MSTRCGVWISIFSFSLVSGFAQQNGPAGQSEPPASVPAVSASRQMTLDVVVTDKSGKPVSGLGQKDFTLLDNKQPQKILSFEAVAGGAAAADSPVEVILFVDEVNTDFKNVAIERNEIVKFLGRNEGALAAPVSLVFYSDSGATGTLSSRDGKAVIADLNQKQLGLRTIGKPAGFYGGNERIQMSLSMLQKFAGFQGQTPGRKLLVWISPGWPFLASGLDQELASDRQKQGLFNPLWLFRTACAGLALLFTISIRWGRRTRALWTRRTISSFSKE